MFVAEKKGENELLPQNIITQGDFIGLLADRFGIAGECTRALSLRMVFRADLLTVVCASRREAGDRQVG